jgi:nucleotide-binding universal stress UspA family protein
MMRSLLMALDGSPRAPGVFAAAVELARRFDATIVPFRAIQIPPEFPPSAQTKQADPLRSYMLHEAGAELARMLEGVDVKWRAPVVHEGQPWRAILAAAEQLDVDLIVLGSHGYHGVDWILGTTAGKVVNLARRNVLVVHDRPAPGDPLPPD